MPNIKNPKPFPLLYMRLPYIHTLSIGWGGYGYSFPLDEGRLEPSPAKEGYRGEARIKNNLQSDTNTHQ